MTEYLTTTQSALAPSSPITEWHAHLDLQVRAGQMAKDTATTYRQGMRKLTEWASQQETWDRRLILEWVAALKAEGFEGKVIEAPQARVLCLLRDTSAIFPSKRPTSAGTHLLIPVLEKNEINKACIRQQNGQADGY